MHAWADGAWNLEEGGRVSTVMPSSLLGCGVTLLLLSPAAKRVAWRSALPCRQTSLGMC